VWPALATSRGKSRNPVDAEIPEISGRGYFTELRNAGSLWSFPRAA